MYFFVIVDLIICHCYQTIIYEKCHIFKIGVLIYLAALCCDMNGTSARSAWLLKANLRSVDICALDKMDWYASADWQNEQKRQFSHIDCYFIAHPSFTDSWTKWWKICGSCYARYRTLMMVSKSENLLNALHVNKIIRKIFLLLYSFQNCTQTSKKSQKNLWNYWIHWIFLGKLQCATAISRVFIFIDLLMKSIWNSYSWKNKLPS